MSNQRYTVEFGPDMALAMLHALSLARATAMAYGRQGAEARTAFGTMLDDLARQIGCGAHPCIDEYDWLHAVRALQSCRAYYWHVRDSQYRWALHEWERGRVTLVVDDVPLSLGWDVLEGADGVRALRDVLERCAHLDAVRGEEVRDSRTPAELRRGKTP